jgi:hypothetical protein
MDEAETLFHRGQAILSDAAKTGDYIAAMHGRALCHRAIELRWYTHTEGNLLDPPWVKRTMVRIGGIEYQAPGPNLGCGDPDYLDWINQYAPSPTVAPQEGQLCLF